MTKKFVGIVGSGMMGRDPFDKHCWSRAGYEFFTTSQKKGVLARAFGVEVPNPMLSLLKVKNISSNKSSWRQKFNLDPLYYSFLTKEIGKNLIESDFNNHLLQIGGIYDVPSLSKGRTKVFSFHDGNVSELSKSPFFPKEYQKYISRAFKWEKKVYEKMDKIFTYTRTLRDSFIQDFGIPEDRVVAVGSGTNFKVPLELNKDYDRKDVLYIGTNFPRKGGTILVEAFSKIYTKHKDAKLHIVGPKQKPNIINDINCPGIIFHGFLSQNNPEDVKLSEELLNKCTLGVLPSFYEPMGVSLMECMTYGMPGIAPNKWAFSEYILNNENGMFMEMGNIDDLADKLDLYLSDSNMRYTHGQKAREFITSYYNWDSVVERIMLNMNN